MSEKYYVTLSDELAEDLEAWCAAEGQKPATLINQLIVFAIRDAKERGLIPETNSLQSTLVRLAAGEAVSDMELGLVANESRVPLGALLAIRACLKPTNGDLKNANEPINH